jgi:hypothetical protein
MPMGSTNDGYDISLKKAQTTKLSKVTNMKFFLLSFSFIGMVVTTTADKPILIVTSPKTTTAMAVVFSGAQ